MAYRKCSICKVKKPKEQLFYAQLKPWCGDVECGTTLSLQLRAKETERKAKAEKKLFRERKAKINDTVPKWTKKAQAAFNEYIRERDRDLPCISCNGENEKHHYTGGSYDCGHYRSRAACPALKFEPLNSAKQCKYCNSFLSGNIVEYRKWLIKRIGPEKLEWLEGPHENKHYRVEDLKEIAAHYRKLTRELKKQREI